VFINGNYYFHQLSMFCLNPKTRLVEYVYILEDCHCRTDSRKRVRPLQSSDTAFHLQVAGDTSISSYAPFSVTCIWSHALMFVCKCNEFSLKSIIMITHCSQYLVCKCNEFSLCSLCYICCCLIFVSFPISSRKRLSIYEISS
jgi:hypothetical protein